ncbi:hypothetical protein [Pontibacter pamirensis]|uniref:hypothetical protein n=1 Tax=Pontibacter pamirensis TaxID=2562824 RepID=UPI00138A3D3A|nr:hypothetical protein [Pontibacter pamirensis]
MIPLRLERKGNRVPALWVAPALRGKATVPAAVPHHSGCHRAVHCGAVQLQQALESQVDSGPTR